MGDCRERPWQRGKGKVKSRAARQAAARDSDFGVQVEGSVVTYVAVNGCSYRVDALARVQVNHDRGTRRPVFRDASKTPPEWLYESGRSQNGGPAPYPKAVGAALECAWVAAHPEEGAATAAPTLDAAWAARRIGGAALRELLGLRAPPGREDGEEAEAAAEEEEEEFARHDGRPPPKVLAAVAAAAGEPDVQAALVGRVLEAGWAGADAVAALRWLRRRGLAASPDLCRRVTSEWKGSGRDWWKGARVSGAWSSNGSLEVLRYLLVEEGVPVGGLVVSSVQHKDAVKCLLARGAVLAAGPGHLRKRLQADGEKLWRARVLAGVQRTHPLVPCALIDRIEGFLCAEAGPSGPRRPARRGSDSD